MILRLSLLLGALLLVGFSDPSPQPKPLTPDEALQAGRALVADILARQPAQNFTNTGVLEIGRGTVVPVTFECLVKPTNWQNIYTATLSNRVEKFFVIHASAQPNVYFSHTNFSEAVPLLGDVPVGQLTPSPPLTTAELSAPFAGSDFWRCDLGLEFLHWPEQKVVKTELRKTRACKVLESTNPQPTPGTYSRVVTWIDTESLGIIHADAYDAAGNWLKEFDPKTVKEVDGQPQLVKMEMYNRQTRSRSQIEFHFDAK